MHTTSNTTANGYDEDEEVEAVDDEEVLVGETADRLRLSCDEVTTGEPSPERKSRRLSGCREGIDDTATLGLTVGSFEGACDVGIAVGAVGAAVGEAS